jgi:hypothetical protein
MIFDRKETLINTVPGTNLGESPVLWTNNSPLITILREYFEIKWNDVGADSACPYSM